MAETSTTTLTCGDCSTELVKKPGGGKPKYCPPCALTRSRAASREYQRRRKAGVKFEIQPTKCAGCGDMFTHTTARGQQPERCPECRESHMVAYQVAYRKARGHLPTGSTVTLICECGTPFEWLVVLGRRAWKCRRCLDAAYQAKKLRDAFLLRSKRPEPDLARVCGDCGACFEQRNVRGPIAARCPACAEGRAKRIALEYGRALSEAISEARRVTFEVEGRWSSCTGCGVALACVRMGLVRQWCERCLPVRRREVLDAWKLANPDAWRDIVHRANRVRRARLRNVVSGPYSRLYILNRDKWICQICKKKISKRLTGRHRLAPSIDHQIPLMFGGPDSAANVVAAHFGCNSEKGSGYVSSGEQLALLG